MLISLTQDCYESLRQIREVLKKEKIQKGEPDKTTFSEIVCSFIKKYQQSITTQKDVGSLTSTPPIIDFIKE
jgi:DNA-binding ferritin-like protein